MHATTDEMRGLIEVQEVVDIESKDLILEETKTPGVNKKLVLATLAATILLTGCVAFTSTKVVAAPEMNLAAIPDAFWEKDFKETQPTKDGSVLALDKQSIDCKTDPLVGFRLQNLDGGNIHYKYTCYEHFERRTASWAYNSGFQDVGGVIYLERQHALCPDNTFMNSFEGVSKNDKTFTYNFVCSEYKVANMVCHDHFTAWADDGAATSVSSLSNHFVMCPDDTGLAGFEGESKSCGWWCGQFRYKYKCCSASVAKPTLQPTKEPRAEPTLHPTREPTLSPFIPITPKEYTVIDKVEFIEEIVIDKEPAIPEADTPIEVEVKLSPNVEILGKNVENPISPAVTEIKQEINHEERDEVPVAEPTMAPTLRKALFCPGKFKATDTDFVPAGCALFARNDIGWSKFKETAALYVCATVDVSPTKLTSAVFKNYKLINGNEASLSIAKPGAGVTITLFNNNLSGESFDVSESNYLPLTQYKFGEGKDGLANDDVKSAIVSSTSETMYSNCKELNNALNAIEKDTKKKENLGEKKSAKKMSSMHSDTKLSKK